MLGGGIRAPDKASGQGRSRPDQGLISNFPNSLTTGSAWLPELKMPRPLSVCPPPHPGKGASGPKAPYIPALIPVTSLHLSPESQAPILNRPLPTPQVQGAPYLSVSRRTFWVGPWALPAPQPPAAVSPGGWERGSVRRGARQDFRAHPPPVRLPFIASPGSNSCFPSQLVSARRCSNECIPAQLVSQAATN